MNLDDMDEMEKIVKESMINEKNSDLITMKKNIDKIISVRFYSAILAGIIAGTLAFTGIIGFCFYIVNFIVASFFVYFYVNSQKGNFFSSSLSLVSSGFFDHGMVYTVFWIMFYNLVHIYV